MEVWAKKLVKALTRRRFENTKSKAALQLNDWLKSLTTVRWGSTSKLRTEVVSFKISC